MLVIILSATETDTKLLNDKSICYKTYLRSILNLAWTQYDSCTHVRKQETVILWIFTDKIV